MIYIKGSIGSPSTRRRGGGHGKETGLVEDSNADFWCKPRCKVCPVDLSGSDFCLLRAPRDQTSTILGQ